MHKVPIPKHLKHMAAKRLKELDIPCEVRADGVYASLDGQNSLQQIDSVIKTLTYSRSSLTEQIEKSWNLP